MLKKPFLLYILVLFSLIFSGTILLLLPGMITQQDFSFIDALFTAVSAVTLTGLEVLKTGTSFSLAGQGILLFLMQTGALLFVIAALYFAYLLKIPLSILPQRIEYFKQGKILKNITLRSLVILFLLEIPATIAIFSLWGRKLDAGGAGTKIFYSVFHAVSAFTNAGFTLFEGGFSHAVLKEMYILHLAVAAFMFLGALGFPAIYDLISIKNLKARMLDPRKDWELNTKISIYAAFFLSFTGAAAFFLLERNHLLANQKSVEAGITAIFHSVSARSSGFSTFDVTNFSQPLLWLFLFFMFIGGSSASMAGGIKVSTIYFLLRGNTSDKNPKLKIRFLLLKVLFISISLILFISLLLHFSEIRHNYFSLLFETVSAFSSSGFSMDVTASLSGFGKILIIISMLSGRILFPGAIFYLLSKQKKNLETNILIG